MHSVQWRVRIGTLRQREPDKQDAGCWANRDRIDRDLAAHSPGRLGVWSPVGQSAESEGAHMAGC